MSSEKVLIACCVLFVLLKSCSGNCGNTTISGEDGTCYMGDCVDGKCFCFEGWQGQTCSKCQGRVLLNDSSGIIEDGPKNYSSPSKCSWVIKPSIPHSTLRLRLNEFASECGWDYLYVYDGDSAFGPLIATFNGLVYTKDFNLTQPPEIVAKSGSAFLHFYSDVAKDMMGFNISYSIDECPYDCFSNGNCNSTESTCDCSSEWSGQVCDQQVCPSNCSNTLGQCEEDDVCSCIEGQHGMDCSVPTSRGAWNTKELTAEVNPRASFSTASFEDTFWMFSGEQFGIPQHSSDIFCYNQTSNQWSKFTQENSPMPRYGHSMLYLNNNKLLVFGGKLISTERTTDELWEYDVAENLWTIINYTSDFGNYTNKNSIFEFGTLSLSGHSANLFRFDNGSEIMVVIFGYHPTMEYSGFVYEYNPVTRFWVRPKLNGFRVNGLFEHTTVNDNINRLLYVHGGMRRSTQNLERSVLTDDIYSYDPVTRFFRKLTSSGVPKYLHASIFVNGVMYVYGGNLYNDTNKVNEPLCYTENFIAYSVVCDRWIELSTPNNSIQAGRYGHEGILIQPSPELSTLYFLSGYDSSLISNALVYTPGKCSAITNENDCIDSFSNGISCYWNRSECKANVHLNNQSICEDKNVTDSENRCSGLNLCSDCLSNSFGCEYCSSNAERCRPSEEDGNCLQNITHCDSNQHYCSSLYNCEQCESVGEECMWVLAMGTSNNAMNCQPRVGNNTKSESQCTRKPCTEIESCSECTKSCMWCVNLKKCFPVNSYVIQFPYGQCMEWSNKQQCPPSDCADLKTCNDCQDNPKCGWCDDGSLTGLGTCKDGSDTGALSFNNSSMEYELDDLMCSNTSWYFTSCPSCQCNGHSQCDEFNECIQCLNQTSGINCENCMAGYYGDARNGGKCEPCQCNNKATTCNSNGNCNCFTKGVVGDFCERCDTDSNYVGNATGNGTCYYPLLINYQFTFSLSAGQDDDITEINFQNLPLLEDDVQLTFEAQSSCRVRMAIISANTIQSVGNEVTINIVKDVTSLQYTFSGSDLQFGKPGVNSTIRIYVSNFTIPLQIKVSLLQRSNKLLTILLILFSSFLVILLIAAAMWKLKMMYDAHHQRRNRAVEMQQMAARPFAGIHLCCDDIYRSTQMLVSPQKFGYQALDSLYCEPDAVCEEKCSSTNTSVISVFLWLPSGCPNNLNNSENGTENNDLKCHVSPPPGQCALAIGTALTNGEKHSVTPIPTPKLISKTNNFHKNNPPFATSVRDSRSDELTTTVTTVTNGQSGSQAPPPAYVNHGMMHTYI